MKFKSLWVALILCAIASQAQASIIFQTAAPNNVTANTLANANLGSHAAENFQLDSPDTIRQITFWGLYTPDDQFPSSFGFSITVYEDDAGLPADLTFAMSKLDVLAVDATSLAYDYPPFNGEIPLRQFTVSLVTPVVIPDTQTYWLEITAFNSPDHPFFLGRNGQPRRRRLRSPVGIKLSIWAVDGIQFQPGPFRHPLQSGGCGSCPRACDDDGLLTGRPAAGRPSPSQSMM